MYKRQVQVRLPDGRMDSLYNGFRVFRAGTVSSVQMGNVTILADNIGITSEDGSRTKLAASGNVSVNGFLYSTGELTITPDQQLSDEDVAAAGQKALYLGASGSVDGDGKLYVSYAQTVATAEKGNSLATVFPNLSSSRRKSILFRAAQLVVMHLPYTKASAGKMQR